MIKKTIAIVLVFISSGAWFYLDCLTRQEKGEAVQLHQGIVQARAEAKKRTEIKTAFGKEIQANLDNCNAVADKAGSDYMSLIEQAVPRKRGLAAIPPAISAEADKFLASAKASCKEAYDIRTKSGS